MLRAQAAVLREPGGDYVLETVEVGDPGPEEVLVRLAAVGHCHTDLIARLGHAGVPMPVVLGHEGAGIVESVGPGVSAITPGDHVVLSFASCRRCPQCLSGHPAACAEFMARNIACLRPDGTSPLHDAAGTTVAGRWFGQSSFASHCVADLSGVVKVDADLPLEALAPLGCGVQTGAGAVLNVLRPAAGGSIAVFGVGAVGLSAVLAARAGGCRRIVAVDLDARRLEIAGRFGATDLVVGGEALADNLSACEVTMIDCTLDTTAATAVIEAALGVLRPLGRLGLVGVGAPAISGAALGGSKTVVSITEGDAVPQILIPQLIRLWESGRFPFDEMTTQYPLADISSAEKAALEGGVVKPVLIPSQPLETIRHGS
jgi:aryl-alcohol dehydrogenase